MLNEMSLPMTHKSIEQWLSHSASNILFANWFLINAPHSNKGDVSGIKWAE